MSNLDLTWAVRGVDAILRHRQRIEEFTDDRHCIFRISTEMATHAAILSDGATIRPGDPLVQIHYWNEHMPALPENGHMAGWASQFRHQIAHSLTLLDQRLDAEPRFRGVAAIHGLPTFPARPGPVALSRACAHLGFDVMPLEHRAIHGLLDSLLVSGLIWTFNPASLRNHGLTRGRIQIWMSRATLAKRYGGGTVGRH